MFHIFVRKWNDFRPLVHLLREQAKSANNTTTIPRTHAEKNTKKTAVLLLQAVHAPPCPPEVNSY